MNRRLMDVGNIIGYNIRLQRKAKGMKQEELAKAIGLSRPSLVNIEQGRQNLYVSHVYAIAKHLRIKVGVLLPEPDVIDELATIRANYEAELAAFRDRHGVPDDILPDGKEDE